MGTGNGPTQLLDAWYSYRRGGLEWAALQRAVESVVGKVIGWKARPSIFRFYLDCGDVLTFGPRDSFRLERGVFNPDDHDDGSAP